MYGIFIDEKNKESQYLQIYNQLKNKIVSGEIKSRTKLTSTRLMSKEIGVSRSVILEVIDQLKTEGFLETIHGSGTYVMENLILGEGYSNFHTNKNEEEEQQNIKISFVAGIPNLELFPRRTWNKCYTQAVENAHVKDFSYAKVQGNIELRQQIVNYLYRIKGIKTTPYNLFITSGASQAIGILSRIKNNNVVVLEDPLAKFIYNIFENNAWNIKLCEVDENGIIINGQSLTGVDFLYLTPSHQFPLGGTLPVKTRIEIIKNSIASGAYIIEDDYDGEYRYDSRPIAPLQTLAPDRVVYIGTFSKTLSPALRLGYMVVPDNLAPLVLDVKSRWDYFTEGLNQMAMAKFMENGYLDRHIRKSMKYYKKLRLQIMSFVKEIFKDNCFISGSTTGLHLILQFPGRVFNKEFKLHMRTKGIYFEPLSLFNIDSTKHYDKVIMGYGQVNIEQARNGLLELQDYLRLV